MKENTRVRVNHDFELIDGKEIFVLHKPYGLVKKVDQWGIKVKLDTYERPIYFQEEDLEVIS